MEKAMDDSVDQNNSGVGERVRLRRDDDSCDWEVGDSGAISDMCKREQCNF
jgi:hypothetical protein